MSDVVVQLPDDAKSFVEQQVASGQFATPSDFILSLVAAAQRRATVARVDQLLMEGLGSGPGEKATTEWWEQTKQEWKRARPGTAKP